MVLEKAGVLVDRVRKAHNLLEGGLAVEDDERLVGLPDTSGSADELIEDVAGDVVAVASVDKEIGECLDVGSEDNFMAGKEEGEHAMDAHDETPLIFSFLGKFIHTDTR